MTPRTWGIAGALLVIVFALSVWLERRPVAPSADLAVAAKVDTITQLVAAKAETVYVASKASAAESRARVRTLRDTLRITDTLEVKAFIARVDTALVKDSVALANADTAIAAEKAVTTAVRAELAIALRPHPAPRFMTTLTGLYEPATHTPMGSAELGLRLMGKVSLVAAVQQRIVLGESPRVYLGARIRL